MASKSSSFEVVRMDTRGWGSAVCSDTCGCPVPCPGGVACRSVSCACWLMEKGFSFVVIIWVIWQHEINLLYMRTDAHRRAWLTLQPEMITRHAHAASTAAATPAHARRVSRPPVLARPSASVVRVAHVQLAMPEQRQRYCVLWCIYEA